MKIISASINMKKIDKTKLINGKKGVYLPITIIVNDELNQYDQDTSISMEQSKEEREAKADKVWLGNGKTVFVSGGAPAPVSAETADSLMDDLLGDFEDPGEVDGLQHGDIPGLEQEAPAKTPRKRGKKKEEELEDDLPI